MIAIGPLRPDDRAEWEPLARGYKAFYRTDLPDAAYDRTWDRLMAGDRVHGLAAWAKGRMVGIAHYLFYAHAWTADVCYLQDLFVSEAARGQGAARALIEAVAAAARAKGAPRLYWQTQEGNETARALYDRVARFTGFIRYDIVLES
jgi:GNAT superfamily N-acetyltransferase